MATATAYTPLNMDTIVIWEGTGTATSTHIQVTNGAQVQNYFGTGFGVDQFGDIISGTLNTTNYFLSGVLQFEVTGLSHSAATVNDFLDARDAQGPLAFLSNGNDTFIGSAGADVGDGFAGSDSINGAGGNDVCRGGVGNDALAGALVAVVSVQAVAQTSMRGLEERVQIAHDRINDGFRVGDLTGEKQTVFVGISPRLSG